MDKKAMAAQLIAMRHQIASLGATVESLLIQLQSEQGCQHKNKIDYTSFGDPEEWECQDCGFHYKEEES